MSRSKPIMERVRAHVAAGILGVTPAEIRFMASEGRIPGAAKFGPTWTFDPAELETFAPSFAEARNEFLKRAERQPEPTVYVVRCDYKVKIGFTRNLAQRLHSLRTANPRPIELLASFPGTEADERSLHERFNELRFSREWFRLKKPIKEWLRDEHGVSLP